MAKAKRSMCEVVIVVIVAVLSVIMGMGLYSGRAKLVRSELLSRELSMLRTSITLYKTINHRNPKGIGVLAGESYNTDGESRSYINHIPGGQGGVAIDPFGNPYLYDPETGWVRSQTLGYEYW